MMMTQSKVFASLAKRGGKGAFAKRWKRQNQRAMAKEASSKRKTVVTKCEKKANAFPKNVSNFFTPLLAFTKANEFEKRSERAYLEYPDSEGKILYSKPSEKANGLVTISQFGPNWRSLRFNDVEQGLSYIVVDDFVDEGGDDDDSFSEEKTVIMDGKVLAYEYLRAMAAATAAKRRLDYSDDFKEEEEEELKETKDKMLMIGMGSGALPLFMETHFSRWFDMETVEHDPVVIEAIERTCFNGNAIPFRCVVEDAREYLETKVANGSLDIISMDAFDGGGNVPEHLISRAFFLLCGEKLKNNNNNNSSPSMFIMNCFNGVRGSTAREFVHVVCARLEKSIGPVMTIPIHDQPCNVIVVALLKKEEREEEEEEDIRAQYSRDAIARSAREAFKLGNAEEWDAGKRVEGLFWVVDCDEKEKTMREIEPPLLNTNTNTKNVEGKYRGRNGTYMPKEFAENIEVYEGQTTDAHSYDDDNDFKRR